MCVVELGKTRVGRTMNIWGITSFVCLNCGAVGRQIRSIWTCSSSYAVDAISAVFGPLRSLVSSRS
jgi:hypothetical protein